MSLGYKGRWLLALLPCLFVLASCGSEETPKFTDDYMEELADEVASLQWDGIQNSSDSLEGTEYDISELFTGDFKSACDLKSDTEAQCVSLWKLSDGDVLTVEHEIRLNSDDACWQSESSESSSINHPDFSIDQPDPDTIKGCIE